MAQFKNRLRRWLPTPQLMEAMPGCAWLGRHLRAHPRLWVLHRRGVALGAALGVGIGVFPVPLQMPAAMLAALALRANVAAAAAGTWLSNPLTLAPIWGLSAYLGSFVVPRQLAVTSPQPLTHGAMDAPATWSAALWGQVTSWGPALLAGFPIAAVLLGLISYGLVYVGWAVLIQRERRRRLRRMLVAQGF